MTSATNSANWNTSNTNFSIFIPFGSSGFTGFPSSSTYGTFFTATCGFNKGSNSLVGGRGKTQMRQDAQGAGWGRWEMGRAGHKDSGDWEGTGICPAPISHILAQAQWRRRQRWCCGPRRPQEQQQANLDTALRQRPGSLVPLPVNTHEPFSTQPTCQRLTTAPPGSGQPPVTAAGTGPPASHTW